MRQNEAAQHRNHERIRTALKELVDPELKASPKSKLRAENFVFSKDQEEQSDRNAEKRDGTIIQNMSVRHARSLAAGRV